VPPVSRRSIFRRCAILAALPILLILYNPAASAQSEHPVTGRKIAPVMGVGGADWLERPEREWEENPNEALDLLNLKKGQTVADVGSGVGYLTLRIARRVGPTGKVYGVDVQKEMLDRLKQNAAKAKLTNIETVLGTETDPMLPAGKVDLILMVDVYHEVSQPQAMLQSMKRALSPEGRLVLVEYRKEDPSIPIRPEHKMSAWEVQTEVEAEGYKLESTIKSLPRQSIFIFRVAKPN
jgi:ubiquinone/menaquinone biosynthesis C-methylase UbiE